jgi:hypothetical protein
LNTLNLKNRIGVAFAVFSLGLSSFALAGNVEDHCDLPQFDLSGQKAASAADCAKQCSQNSSCKAFVYISGWGRCQFKSKPSKHKKITFYAGGNQAASSNAREITAPAVDRDITSRDMKRVDGVKTAEDCHKVCVNEPKCQAFTFIAGYDVCWLKDKTKAAIEKIFYCGEI